jgi:hypothetical protein
VFNYIYIIKSQSKKRREREREREREKERKELVTRNRHIVPKPPTTKKGNYIRVYKKRSQYNLSLRLEGMFKIYTPSPSSQLVFSFWGGGFYSEGII